MRHEDIQELLGAYALDAVEPGEAAAVESHLATCPRCRDEVRDHREAAALLAYAGAPAPEGLWDRVAASLEEAPPPVATPRLGPVAARRRRAQRPRIGGTVAAACAVAVLGVVGAGAVQVRDRLDDQEQRILQGLTARQGREAAEAALAVGARTAHLVDAEQRPVADAVVLPDGSGYLVAKGMPSLRPERTYQLWAVTGGSKVSVGVLGAKVDVAAFRVDPRTLDALAVTDERAPGVVSSDQQALGFGLVEGEQGTATTTP